MARILWSHALNKTLIRVVDIGSLLTSSTFINIVEHELGYTLEGCDTLHRIRDIERMMDCICNNIFDFVPLTNSGYTDNLLKRHKNAWVVHEYMTDHLGDLLISLIEYTITDMSVIISGNNANVHITYK